MRLHRVDHTIRLDIDSALLRDWAVLLVSNKEDWTGLSRQSPGCSVTMFEEGRWSYPEGYRDMDAP